MTVTTDHADTEETPMHVRTPQTHAQPTGDGAAVTPCCGRHPAELPGGDRVLAHPLDAFCPGVLDSARLHGDAVDEFDAHDQLLAGILRRALHRNLSIRHRGGGMVRVHVGPVDLRSAADADVLDVLRFHASEAVTDDEETDNFEPGGDDRVLADLFRRVIRHPHFRAEEAAEGHFVLHFPSMTADPEETRAVRGAWCAKPDIYGPWRPGTS